MTDPEEPMTTDDASTPTPADGTDSTAAGSSGRLPTIDELLSGERDLDPPTLVEDPADAASDAAPDAAPEELDESDQPGDTADAVDADDSGVAGDAGAPDGEGDDAEFAAEPAAEPAAEVDADDAASVEGSADDAGDTGDVGDDSSADDELADLIGGAFSAVELPEDDEAETTAESPSSAAPNGARDGARDEAPSGDSSAGASGSAPSPSPGPRSSGRPRSAVTVAADRFGRLTPVAERIAPVLAPAWPPLRRALELLALPLRFVPRPFRDVVDWVALTLVCWVPIVWAIALASR